VNGSTVTLPLRPTAREKPHRGWFWEKPHREKPHRGWFSTQPAHDAAERGAMSLPRDVLPGRFYLITRRCTQRQFLLRPDDETNNAFTYCLGEAAQRLGIVVLLMVAMSNHHHMVIYDRYGNYPAFLEHFHKMLARCLNALRGRWENFWSSEQVCVVHCVGFEDVINKLVYVALNPVKDHLVERVHHWPGVNGLSPLLANRPLRATRPRHFFRNRKGSPMPEEVTLELTIPPELGSREQVLRLLRERVEAGEASIAATRRAEGRRVLGRRAVKAQSPNGRPTSVEPRRGLRPRVAARSQWARIEALQRNREFLDAYRDARARWIRGEAAEFPIGTYWLRRFAQVPLIQA
jgi:putative transposase